MAIKKRGGYVYVIFGLLFFGGRATVGYSDPLIFATSGNGSDGAVPALLTNLPMSWYYGAFGDPSVEIFQHNWTTAEIGTTLTITAADPNFSIITGLLTDGISETQTVQTANTGESGPESVFIYAANPDPRIDLHGYNITSITLTLDSMSLSPQTFPFGGTAYTSSFTFMGYGTVAPEPTSLSLLGIGVLAFRYRRHRHNASST